MQNAEELDRWLRRSKQLVRTLDNIKLAEIQAGALVGKKLFIYPNVNTIAIDEVGRDTSGTEVVIDFLELHDNNPSLINIKRINKSYLLKVLSSRITTKFDITDFTKKLGETNENN